MIKQAKETNHQKIWVDKFDEEDWRELLLLDSWKPFEDDKALMRVI
jgi:hypothetical protein